MGIDIGALKDGVAGDPLYAIADATVVRVGYTNGGKGDDSVLEIRLPNGDTAVYLHGKFNSFEEGAKLKAGDIVGTMSDIGSKGAVHLHFEIRKGGAWSSTDYSKFIDPKTVLPL